MDLSRARDFARTHHHAVMVTRTPSGGIQQSPVVVGVDDEGRFVVSTRETAYKTHNLRRDPWVQLCIIPDTFFGDWVLVEGRAEVLSLPDAIEPLVDYYRGVAGEHDDWEDYREDMRRQRRVLVRIDGRRAGPDHGG